METKNNTQSTAVSIADEVIDPRVIENHASSTLTEWK